MPALIPFYLPLWPRLESSYVLALVQSVPSWLELELAQAKKLELGWLGSARRQGQNPSLARLGLKIILNFRAELGSGSEKLRFTS